MALTALLRERVALVRPENRVTVFLAEEPKRSRPPGPPSVIQPARIKVHLVFDAPILSALPVTESRAEDAAPLSGVPKPVAEVPLPAAVLIDELAVVCPERSPPVYPPESRRLREEGEVTLRVELDLHGNVSAASVVKSSGFVRLDQAAHAAVLTWHCNAAMRGGQPTRAVAMQSLDFVLKRP